MLVIKNAYFVEVPLTTVNNGQRINFADIPQLRNTIKEPVVITGIEAIYNVTLTKAPSGASLVTAPAGLMVTLVSNAGQGNKEVIYQMPYYNLVGILNGGIIKEFKRLKINLVKSYITITDASVLTAGQSAAFMFYYE